MVKDNNTNKNSKKKSSSGKNNSSGAGGKKSSAPKMLKSFLFTKGAQRFAAAAKALDVAVKDLYGPHVSISDLTSCLEEVRDKKVSPDMVDIPKDILSLWKTYCSEQLKRKEEKSTFLSSFEVGSIKTDFKSIDNLFKGVEKEEKDDEEG